MASMTTPPPRNRNGGIYNKAFLYATPAPGKRNLRRNSSFETGFEWYSLMRGIYFDDGKKRYTQEDSHLRPIVFASHAPRLLTKG